MALQIKYQQKLLEAGCDEAGRGCYAIVLQQQLYCQKHFIIHY
jgi:hypothetical protein